MKTIGGFEFPETKEEAATWQPAIRHEWLAQRVLAAARTRIEGEWAAYIDGDSETLVNALDNGTKLRESVARAIFPQFEQVPYAPSPEF